uniref:eIF-4F 25 kDa subunit n=1 Tax=Romanomermis culicivorax TaxID=13658 RepID=A0A915K008_ROMCU
MVNLNQDSPIEKESKQQLSDESAIDSLSPGKTESDPDRENEPNQAVVVDNDADNVAVAPLPPSEFLVKHPLMYTWVLWYCKSEKNKNWEDCLKEVAEFDTVEDFWALYNHIQLASGLPWGSDYYVFKKGIRPMWEDVQNKEGGRWLIVVERNQRQELLDIYWLELLMAVIGEQFDDGSHNICGAVVNIRNKGDKISLWTRDCLNEESNRKIGQIFKAKLGIPNSINYEVHKDTSQKTGSMVRAQLRV